jgi:hypothetical protein
MHKIWFVVNAFHGMKVIAFQNVMKTCSLVDKYKHFGGTCCLHFRVGCHDTESACIQSVKAKLPGLFNFEKKNVL